jgi:hypothetical protein
LVSLLAGHEEAVEVVEPLPVSARIKVLRSKTLFRSGRWWAAAALIEAFGRKHVALYLWFRRGEFWKRRQKFVFRSKDEWSKAKSIIDSFIEEL